MDLTLFSFFIMRSSPVTKKEKNIAVLLAGEKNIFVASG
jgi:hypothetical protein